MRRGLKILIGFAIVTVSAAVFWGIHSYDYCKADAAVSRDLDAMVNKDEGATSIPDFSDYGVTDRESKDKDDVARYIEIETKDVKKDTAMAIHDAHDVIKVAAVRDVIVDSRLDLITKADAGTETSPVCEKCSYLPFITYCGDKDCSSIKIEQKEKGGAR